MAIETQGSIFYFSTSTALSTNIAVGQVTGFNGPSGSAGVIDVTHLQSTAKEKMIGLRDEGQITLDLNCVPGDSGQVKMRENRAQRTKSHWALKFNDTSITMLDGKGYVSGYAVTGSVDNKVTLAVTIEITGPVSWSTVA